MATDDLIMFCNTEYLPGLNTLYTTILDTEITQKTLLLVTSMYDTFGTKEPRQTDFINWTYSAT